MPPREPTSVDHGAELMAVDCLADQTCGSSSVAAGWDLVQHDWSQRLRERERRQGPSCFAARIPSMYTRVRRFVRVILVRSGDDHARGTPPDP